MQKNYQIMFIDDDEDDIMLFEHAIHKTDPNVVCIAVTSCAEALEKLEAGLLPTIIFLDLNMPLMHGFECLSAIKRSPDFGSIPVIIYSTSGYSIDVDKAHNLGAAGYFKKPSDCEKLGIKIQTFISHITAEKSSYIVDI